MTKKHFEQFAQQIKRDLESNRPKPISSPVFADSRLYAQAKDRAQYAAEVFATIAQIDNDKFDRERFFTACGLR